MALSSKI